LEILKEVDMKNSVFRDITPCSPTDTFVEHVAYIFRVEENGKENPA
jgi:hypothetical protein